MTVVSQLAIAISFAAASIATATAAIDFARQRDVDPPVRQIVDRAFAALAAKPAAGLAAGRGDRLRVAMPPGGARSVTVEQHVGTATSALVRLPLVDGAGRGGL